MDNVCTDEILSPKGVRTSPQYPRDNKYTSLKVKGQSQIDKGQSPGYRGQSQIDKGQSPGYRGQSLNDRGLGKY